MSQLSPSEFVKKLKSLEIHAQGIAVREPSGTLRCLDDDEKRSLGIEPLQNMERFEGQEVAIPGTGLILRILPT